MMNYRELRKEACKAVQAIEKEYVSRVKEVTDNWVGRYLISNTTGDSHRILEMKVHLELRRGIQVYSYDGSVFVFDSVEDLLDGSGNYSIAEEGRHKKTEVSAN